MNVPGWLRHYRRTLVRGLVLVLATFAAVTVLLGLWLRAATGPRRPPSAESFVGIPHVGSLLPSLWSPPAFALTDQRGGVVTSEALRGRPYIADFIFTQCTSACPILTAKMVMLQRRLSDADVRFVSFSVDPVHDTRDSLAIYATHWNAMEPRWSLLSTSHESLRQVAAGFRVMAEATQDPDSPILHSALFFLVDGDGAVRGVYPSTDDRALEALLKDARSLARAPASAPPASSGSLYASLGCGGCHDNARIAPPLVDLHGPRRLEGGGSVEADDAYLRTSILEPPRDHVAGYALLMPSYRAQLTDAQLDGLVAELRTRVSDAGTRGAPEPAAARVFTDPVCEMKVRAEPGGIHATVEGTEHWFCSEMCRDAFVKDPHKFKRGR
jgi:protein SCO1/2